MNDYTTLRVKKSTVKELKDIKNDNDMGCTHEFLILKMINTFRESLKV